MSDITYVTKETFEKIREELNELRTTGRAKIAEQIAEAREKGDLKENAEYDAAKEAQGIHEAEIAKLEQTLANTRILDKKDLDLSRVSVLCKVKLTNLKTNKSVTYQLVSAKEADLKQKKLSVSSPIGKGLLGKKVGEEVEIKIPAGQTKFRVDDIFI
ncbi:MAG TPA: transcription elongation factor GreA [Chitinophagaceae bacterium]|nr:transcription elongation factor GreA [Chitinophagaceae bacterium]